MIVIGPNYPLYMHSDNPGANTVKFTTDKNKLYIQNAGVGYVAQALGCDYFTFNNLEELINKNIQDNDIIYLVTEDMIFFNDPEFNDEDLDEIKDMFNDRNFKITGITSKILEKFYKNQGYQILELPNTLFINLLKTNADIALINGSTGCINRCAFCKCHQNYKLKDPEILDFEFNFHIKNGINKFLINSPTCTIDEIRMIHRILKNKNVEYSLCTRVDQITDEYLSLAKESGCIDIFIGIESFNQETLNAYNKNISVSNIYNAIDLLKKYQINYRSIIIVGYPGQTKESINFDLKKVCFEFPELWINKLIYHENSNKFNNISKENQCSISDDEYNALDDIIFNIYTFIESSRGGKMEYELVGNRINFIKNGVKNSLRILL